MAEIESSPEHSREDVVPVKRPPPELEDREPRPAGDGKRDVPPRPYGEVYLIERQAIELRRARVSEAADAARSRPARPTDGDFEFPSEPAQSSDEELNRYRRPKVDAAKPATSSGLRARVAAWLRRALGGN